MRSAVPPLDQPGPSGTQQQSRRISGGAEPLPSRPRETLISAQAAPLLVPPPHPGVREPIVITIPESRRQRKNATASKEVQDDGYSSDSFNSSKAKAWKREEPNPVISAYIIKNGRSHSVFFVSWFGLCVCFLLGLYFLSSTEPC